MPILLRKEAGKYLREKGHKGISDNYLYQLIRSGRLKHCRAGNRILICTDAAEKLIMEEMESSIIRNDEAKQTYGQLRRIESR